VELVRGRAAGADGPAERVRTPFRLEIRESTDG
jgi:hypothetical protein